jgi:hypothetical protein
LPKQNDDDRAGAPFRRGRVAVDVTLGINYGPAGNYKRRRVTYSFLSN